MQIVIALLIAVIFLIILYLLLNNKGNKGDVVQTRLRDMNDRSVKNTDDYMQQQLEVPLKERLLNPILEETAANIKRFTPGSWHAVAKDLVERSGNFQGRGMAGFMVYMIVLVIAFVSLAMLYTSRAHVSVAKAMLLYVLAVVAGLGFPFFIAKSMVEERQEQIRRAMPDVLDLLCVSVQAGMGFDGAMSKVTAKMKGPLIEECDRLLQDLRMGVTRRNALLRLSERCGIKEMQLFVAALIQSEKLGVGLAQVLEIQSENMRELRRQRAREIAAKMPTKILFPLLVFIFPVLFVVALGPPLVIIIKNFVK